ncbi:MAG: tRNA-queuosine alpha-mannosyltransferase domain-containing protein [Kangiellaceae bacterium]
MSKRKILLLSGYDAPSHQYWRECLSEYLPEFNWTQIALPPRHFAWRIRGNAFNFVTKYRAILEKDYDLLIVTSMVDLNNLRGLIPKLSNIPTLLYFHENQFAYPRATDNEIENQNLLNAQITSMFSCYGANKILFNSKFNLNSFFEGVLKLAKKLPDGLSTKEIEGLKDKSKVIPVPIKHVLFEHDKHLRTSPTPKQDNAAVKILWNHRWEFDKQPEVFFKAMSLLRQQNVKFELYIMGQSFREQPECFTKAKMELENQIKVMGYQPLKEYQQILKSADIVISSASHDFQGLSMLEAIYHGCVPIAPNRVAYPEYIKKELLYRLPEQSLNLSKVQLLEKESKYLSEKILKVVSNEEFKNNRAQMIESCQSLTRDYSVNHLLPIYKNEILKLIN